MIYDVVNMHDRFTIEASSDAIAKLAMLLLGHGHFKPLRQSDGKIEDCLFSIGATAAGMREWMLRHFGSEDFLTVMSGHWEETAACLLSIVYGDAKDRERFVACNDRDMIVKWNEKKATSARFVAAEAADLAARMTEKFGRKS